MNYEFRELHEFTNIPKHEFSPQVVCPDLSGLGQRYILRKQENLI